MLIAIAVAWRVMAISDFAALLASLLLNWQWGGLRPFFSVNPSDTVPGEAPESDIP